MEIMRELICRVIEWRKAVENLHDRLDLLGIVELERASTCEQRQAILVLTPVFQQGILVAFVVNVKSWSWKLRSCSDSCATASSGDKDISVKIVYQRVLMWESVLGL